MKVVSLFTGIGGLDLGLVEAGHEVIMMCESDPSAQQVLRSRFPGVLLKPDVTALESLPADTDLVTAGFPCIDISRAGLKKGVHEGASTGLVRHVFRLLDDSVRRRRPVQWVLLENVEALLDRQDGGVPAIEPIVTAFEALGYGSWASRVVCSAAFGVPNRRRRLFILVSWSGDSRDVLLAQGPMKCVGGCHDPAAPGARPCFECHEPDLDADDGFSVAMDMGNARSAPGIDLVPTFTTNNRRMCLLLATGLMGTLRIEDAERLQGFPAGWTEAAWPVQGVGVTAHRTGLGSGEAGDKAVDKGAVVRFQLIGNAVTVPVATWLGKRLMRCYAYKFVHSPQDGALTDELQTRELLDMDPDDTALGSFEPMVDHGLLIRRRQVQPLRLDGLLQGLEAGRGRAGPVDGGGAAGSASPDPGEANDDDHGSAREAPEAPDDAQAGTSRRRYSQAAKDTWPKAAWWLRGGLRVAAACCDAPVKRALVPLHEFIRVLGPPPPLHAMNTYVLRLREQGWNVWQAVQRAIKCGALLDAEIVSVARLPGAGADRDCIGQLVWAPIPGHEAVHWPAEALDAAKLPKGRSIPREALVQLNQTERSLLQQHVEKHATGKAASKARVSKSGAVAATDAGCDADGAREALGSDAEQQPDAAPGPEQAGHAVRRVQGGRSCKEPKRFLMFFGTNNWCWQDPERLQEFAKHRALHVAHAQQLRAQGRLPHSRLFDTAMEHAGHFHTLLTGDAASADFAAAAAARASLSAATVNTLPRCGKCESCVNQLASARRRCLLVRAYAAAAGGHTGAQLAVMGAGAVGATINVWWPLDEMWYKGVVIAYDDLRVRHTVHYEDGDVEIIPLWSPTQMLRLHNKVADFGRQAAAIAKQAEAEAAKATARREALQHEAQLHDVSGLELVRLQRVQENEAKLREMVPEAAAAVMATAKRPPALRVAAPLTPERGTASPALRDTSSAPREVAAAESGQGFSPTGFTAAMLAAGCSGATCLPKTSGLTSEDLANMLPSPASGRATRQKTVALQACSRGSGGPCSKRGRWL